MNLAMFNQLYNVLKKDYVTFEEAQKFINFDEFRKAEDALKVKE